MLQRESVFGSQTPALRYVSTGKPRGPISPVARWSAKGLGGSGVPLAPWALLLGWWSPQLETNSKRLLLRGVG